MPVLLGIGFTAPWLLACLAGLPILWLVLRAVPPAPVRRRFPGVALLLGLADNEAQADKTPWWLLLLRMLAVALIILGFAGPVLNPKNESAGEGPLLILVDGTWADARDWQRRVDRIGALLEEAGRAARPVAMARLTGLPEGDLLFQAADAWAARLPALKPSPWEPDAAELEDWIEGLPAGPFDTFWVSDGLARGSRGPMLRALEARGSVVIIESPRPVVALRPARFEDGEVVIDAMRTAAGEPAAYALVARGLDPSGAERSLAAGEIAFESGGSEASVSLSLPPELRNRITRFELPSIRSAGAVTLSDDALRRREVALIAGRDSREGLELLSPLHYLEQALEPAADLIDGDLLDILPANPDVLILADVATISEGEEKPLLDWVENGGLLLRFAGPRLAASDVSRDEEHALMPVRLRAGGRAVGGAMSWGEPKKLRPFPEGSPFFGLAIPDDVAVSSQVMAQPDPDLSSRVIASLADGTPLATRKRVGSGQVVLFHVTANAEWSTLPLSGLFVRMLERLAVSSRPAAPKPGDLAGTVWAPDVLLDAFGIATHAGALPGVPGEALAEAVPGADMPPGLYTGEDRRIAVNAVGPETELAAASWPGRIAVDGIAAVRETALKGWLLAGALALFCLDILASLLVAGRIAGGASRGAAAALGAWLLLAPAGAEAQPDDEFARLATSEVSLAHVVTGVPRIDEIAAAGLRGLSGVLWRRTSVEPASPIAVDLETSELSFFAFLYWPIAAEQPMPSLEAYAKLNRYLRNGGMILFDTRDADISRFGQASPNGRKLRQLARPLDIPPLEPLPEDHVLTRTFYLLQDFPGRHSSRDVWVEASPTDAEQVEGMPFRNLNDNVTPVVIGGNDWASAWATDEAGNHMFPVGRGYAGEQQRELANRFGVNLIMHVLTGNYKSDQVHVPALLDRLGQ